MTASPGPARDRLLALAGSPAPHAPAGPRWTPAGAGPAPPADDAGARETHAGEAHAADAADVAARWRQGALARVGGLYTAEHGHPLEHGPLRARERTRPRGRWGVPLRLALTTALAVSLVGGGVAVRALSAPRGPQTAEALPEVAGPTSPTGDAAATQADGGGSGAGVGQAATGGAASVVVHVVGQVALPGLVSLPAGSRVADAVTAVGGATEAADLAAVNLARQLVDGEQVLVPLPGQSVPAGTDAAASGAGPASGGGSSLVDLNTADLAALDGLPGIGPVLAERVVAWRQEHGRFSDVEELGEVSGIGPTLLSRLRPLVRV